MRPRSSPFGQHKAGSPPIPQKTNFMAVGGRTLPGRAPVFTSVVKFDCCMVVMHCF